jgi:hypothetical protein
MPTDSAYDRLPEDLRFKLDNIAASWQMEGQPPSPAELEILARFLLGDITAEERDRLMHRTSPS